MGDGGTVEIDENGKLSATFSGRVCSTDSEPTYNELFLSLVCNVVKS